MATRPITDTLRLLDGGAFLDLASQQLADTVRAVEQTGKAGKLVITLELKTVSGGAMSITPRVKAGIPEAKPDSTLLWATVEGNLTTENPHQQKLDLRSIAPATTTELRTA